MMRKPLHIVKQTAAGILLLLFASYYVDVNFFVHAHIINGVTIIHSHIHRSNHHDTDSGGHTATEINLIAQVNALFLYTEAERVSEAEALYYLMALIGVEQEAKTASYHLSAIPLRAPPAEVA